MVDQVTKALRKLNNKERMAIDKILKMVKSGEVKTLDAKRLKRNPSVYRVRKGDIRILYQISKGRRVKILAVERRSYTTY